MAVQDDLSDPWAIIRELVARVEILERQNPLHNAAITSSPGIRVATPEGLRGAHKDSVSIEVDEGLKIKPGASVKVDPGAKIDVGGEVVAGGAKISAEYGGHLRGGKTSVGSDGVIRNDDGKVTVEDRLDPLDGVNMTWGGARHTIETVMGWQKTDIETVDGRAQDARTAANTAQLAANTAQATANTGLGRANDAYSLASGKASQSEVDGVQTQIGTIKVKINAIIDAHNAKHPDAPVAKF